MSVGSSGRRTAAVLFAWVAAAAGVAVPRLAGAQGDAPAAPGGELRRVEGRVLRGSGSGEQPLSGQFVVLHRISSDSAGPVDSVRTGRDGRYVFSYRAAADRPMYIVSTRYSGIAYFTPPLTAAVVRGDSATVMVYDTSSAGEPLVARGRHFIVSPPEASGSRRVVDVFEVANESPLTRVAGSNPHGTWRVQLPDGATNPQVGQGDIPPDAVRFAQGSATIFSPFSPGIRQVVLTYELPPSAGDVALPFDQPVSTLEVLVEGGGAQASGPVQPQEGVALEGRQFDRFLGQDVPRGAVVRLTLPGGRADFSRLRTLALVALAGLALTLGIVHGRRGRGAADGTASAEGPATEEPSETHALARAIAALDDAHEGRDGPSPEEVAAYAQRRAALKAQLIAALAAEDEVGAPT